MSKNKVLFDFLIQAKIDPNYIPHNCTWSNLLGAARLKHGLYYLKEMCKVGLDIHNVSLENAKNPISYAIENNCIDIVEYLIKIKNKK